jgi:general secretion pathway protein C
MLGAAAFCAVAAYWGLLLARPAPPPVAAAISSTAAPGSDARLAARMFGDTGAASASALAVQVGGVMAASRNASAVLSVDGRPARAYLVGQEVAPGTVLAGIGEQVVTLERAGVRTRYPVPALAAPQNAPTAASAAAGLGAATGATPGAAPVAADGHAALPAFPPAGPPAAGPGRPVPPRPSPPPRGNLQQSP